MAGLFDNRMLIRKRTPCAPFRDNSDNGRSPARLFGLLLLLVFCPPGQADMACTYETFTWDTVERRAVGHTRVAKSFAELTPAEIDDHTGCSVCEQDQVTIEIPPLAPFKICRVIAPRLEPVLRRLLRRGEPIRTLYGYRVGKTRGDVDERGRRTQFSNHSFGIAIDINPDANGLYDNCIEFSPGCRLIRGGRWDPARPGSLHGDSGIVAELEAMGLRWGGSIFGKQKDFMHFSPTGY